MGRYGNKKKSFRVTEDFDSSEDNDEDFEVTQDFDSANENRKSIIKNLKERISNYRSPEAKQMRRTKKLEKRDREIEDLTYKAKKEKLKSVVRKSRAVANPYGSSSRGKSGRNGLSIHYPKHDYSGMDRMLGLSGPQKQSRKSSKPSNNWSNMDRMLGVGK